MSRIGDIREALATVIAGAEGITTSYPYPVKPTTNGVAWLGFFATEVEDAQRTVDVHHVPLTVCVNLNQSQHVAGLKATEPLIDAVRAVLRVNQSLGLADVMRVQVLRMQQAAFGEPAEFIGFQMTLEIKESYGASFTD